MSVMLGKLYDALLNPGNPDKAREAAEEVAAYDKDLNRLRIEVRAHSVVLGLMTALLLYLLGLVLDMSHTLAAVAAKIGVP